MSFLQRLYFDHCLFTAMWAGGIALALQLFGAIGGWNAAVATRAVSVALVVGFFAGLVTVDGLPPLPVSERWQWVPWLTAAALLLLHAEEGNAAAATRVPLLVVLAGALEWLVLRRSLSLGGSSETMRMVVLIAVGAALSAVLWAGEARVAPIAAWRVFMSFAITAAGAAFCYAATISARFGQMTGGLASVLGAVAVVGLVKSDSPAGRTPVTIANMAFGGMLLVNSLSSDFPKTVSLLLLASWSIPLVPHSGTAKTNSLQLGAVVLTTALAALIAKG